MISAQTGIDDYLAWLARELAAGASRAAERYPAGLVAVLGSSAADPDSLAGPLAYAFLLHREQLRAGGVRPPALVVAPLPIRREELGLRPEGLELLRVAGISPDALIDRDRLDPAGCPLERLSIVLVDTPGRELPPDLQGRVVEVLDHHAPAEGLPESARRLTAEVGSACTLVAEQMFRRIPQLVDPHLALLLLGPILLDTVNLDPDAGRVTERDRRAAARLGAIAGAEARGLYGTLARARARLDGLSAGELLRRDYKEGAAGGLRYALASVPLSAEDWRSRAGGRPDACLCELVRERGLDLAAVLFAFAADGGEFRRQLLLGVGGDALLQALEESLDALGLGLVELSGFHPAGDGGGGERGSADPPGCGAWRWALYQQRNARFSRKRLEPELRRILESRKAAAGGR
jgi:exopolyphosphatase